MTNTGTSSDFRWPKGHQYYAAIAGNLVMLGHGTILGWISPAITKLSSPDTPLETGPLTSLEISWIAAITSIGAMCGSLTFGFIAAWLGCKRTMMFLALPTSIFWVLIYFGNTYYHILMARFITGWTGGGVQTTGFEADWAQSYKSAEDALKYYNGYKGKTEAEINAFNAEFERMKSIAHEQKTDGSLQFSDFTNAKALKGLLIGTALAYFSQLSGCATIILFAVFILERTGTTTIDPYKASIALAVVLILGNLCTTQFADMFGRKTFLIISLMGCAVGHIGLASFLYMNQLGYDLADLSFIPVVCLGFVVFIAAAGIVPLSHVCRVENLPTKIRTIGMAICVFGLNCTSFACAKLFPILIEEIGMHCCMIIFAVNCVIGSVFMFFILDETRGKPMDTLQSENNNKEVTA